MNGPWRNIRYAARSLGKAPAMTLIALVTLALGIGVNTAIFSLVIGVFLAPLPCEQPEELAFLRLRNGETGKEHSTVPYALFEQWSEQSPGQLAALRVLPMDLLEGGLPERVAGRIVSQEYFELFTARLEAGRTFIPADYEGDATPVAILSHRPWTERFDADPDSVGQAVELDGKPFTIVRVLAAGFQDVPVLPRVDTTATAFWVPNAPGIDRRVRGHIRAYRVFARLPDDESLASAASASAEPLCAISRPGLTGWEVGLTVIAS